MASKPTLSVSSTDRVLTLITSSFAPLLSSISTVHDNSSPSTLTLSDASTITGTNTIAAYLAPYIFSNTTYDALETAQINQWLSLTSSPKLNSSLDELNENLKDKTTLLGSKLSIADVVAYTRISDIAKGWSTDERTGGTFGGFRYLVRWIDYVQNTPALNLKIEESEKVKVDLDDVKTVIRAEEAKKDVKGKGKEKDEGILDKAKGAIEAIKEQVVIAGKGVSEGAQTKKKEKKEKASKPAAVKKEEAPLSPSLIDLRVGFIEKCVPHENADSLFVSTIQCGDAEGPRTVCSGLNGLIPIEEMQQRYVIVVCNLKPVTMRGVKSAAMVLAASPKNDADHKGPVELVTPPSGSKAGEKVFFEGYNGTPEAQLNPKKKIWEGVQPGFTTTSGLEVGFDAAAAGLTGDGVKKLVTASGGVCTVPTLIDAVVR